MAPNITNQTAFKTESNAQKDVVCKFGVLTDAQYANIDDRPGNCLEYLSYYLLLLSNSKYFSIQPGMILRRRDITNML